MKAMQLSLLNFHTFLLLRVNGIWSQNKLHYGINQIHLRDYKVTGKLSNFKVKNTLKQLNNWKDYLTSWHLIF